MYFYVSSTTLFQVCADNWIRMLLHSQGPVTVFHCIHSLTLNLPLQDNLKEQEFRLTSSGVTTGVAFGLQPTISKYCGTSLIDPCRYKINVMIIKFQFSSNI